MMRLTRWFMGLVVMSTMIFTVGVPAAQAAEVDLNARLSGSATYPRATGFSEYDRSSTEREVDVIVRNIGTLSGDRVIVYVSGTRVGSIVVSHGVAHHEWDTERGDRVPVVSAGDPIRVRTPGGTLVASGKYVREHND